MTLNQIRGNPGNEEKLIQSLLQRKQNSNDSQAVSGQNG